MAMFIMAAAIALLAALVRGVEVGEAYGPLSGIVTFWGAFCVYSVLSGLGAMAAVCVLTGFWMATDWLAE